MNHLRLYTSGSESFDEFSAERSERIVRKALDRILAHGSTNDDVVPDEFSAEKLVAIAASMPFGQTFFVKRLVRHVAEGAGMDSDSARWMGAAAGAAIGLFTLDLLGAAIDHATDAALDCATDAALDCATDAATDVASDWATAAAADCAADWATAAADCAADWGTDPAADWETGAGSDWEAGADSDQGGGNENGHTNDDHRDHKTTNNGGLLAASIGTLILIPGILPKTPKTGGRVVRSAQRTPPPKQFFTNVGPPKGPVLKCPTPSIYVFDDPEAKRQVGIATPDQMVGVKGPDQKTWQLKAFRLRLDAPRSNHGEPTAPGTELPGRYVVIGRRFALIPDAD
jgi:hypothetical protein